MGRKQKDTEVLEQLNGIPVYQEMPEGWDYLKGAATAPCGYRWIWNRESRFARKNHENVKYKDAFLVERKR